MKLLEQIQALPSDKRVRAIDQLRSKVSLQKPQVALSVFFFGDQGDTTDLYKLLFDCSLFADRYGFQAIWLPERHFNEFGAPYPNPATIAAAVAAKTTKLHVRAGSVVAPLHSPLRLVEDWSVVDHVSHGRVGLAFASGWLSQDFVLSEGAFDNRRQLMMQRLSEFRSLWSGAKLPFCDKEGNEHLISTYPRPKTASPSVWLTAASNPETWKVAAENDCGILTGMMEQNNDQLAERIALFRKTRSNIGLDPDARPVTAMVHTFVGENDKHSYDVCKIAMIEYLTKHMSLYSLSLMADERLDLKAVSEKDKRDLVELGFERYFERSALIGGSSKVSGLMKKLKVAGVNEIAALVNFGLPNELVMSSLVRLNATWRSLKQ